MHTYLAPWQWDRQEPAWNAPAQAACRGVLDLRPLPKRRSPGLVEGGMGLFAYAAPQPIPDGVYLGERLDGLLTSLQRSAIESFIGVSLFGSSLRNILLELYSKPGCYDPTGEVLHKPCRVGARQRFLLRFAGQDVARERVTSEQHPVWQSALAVRHADYRRNRAAGMDAGTLRRMTGHDMQRLYGRMGDDLLAKLLPAEHRGDGWEAPHTSYSDDFARADEQLDADANWTTVAGPATDWNIVSGQLEYFSSSFGAQAKARYEQNLDSDAHVGSALIVQVDAQSGYQAGVVIRFASGADTNIGAHVDYGDTYVRTFTTIGGSRSNLTDETITPTGNAILVIQATADDNITTSYDGTPLHDFTDTTGTGNVQGGLHGRNGDSTTRTTMDNFSLEDLAAGGGSILPMQIQHYYAGAS